MAAHVELQAQGVVALATARMRDLENCPKDINKNKMFQCVSTINGDWEKKWAENPKHMDLDFAMLLSVCVPCIHMVLNKTAGPDL